MNTIPTCPPDWTLKRVKHVASLRAGEGITSESIEDIGAFPVYGGNGFRGYTSAFTHDGQHVLIGRQGALCGNVHLVSGQFWASEHAVVATFYAGDSPAWARYVFEMMNLGQYSVSAAQPGLAVDRVKEIFLLVPPLEEQVAIAAYLDAETARIDALISEKESLLSALAELKQVVVTEAVSIGVRSNNLLESSGTPWFPRMPATWGVKRLKFIVRRIEQGWSPQTETRPAEDSEWGVLKAGACNGGEFREDEQKALPSAIKPDLSLEVREGDILMSRGSGSADLVGSVALVGAVRPRLMLSDLLYRLSVDDPSETSAQWLVMALGSAPLRRQIRLSLRGAEGLTRKITTTDIKELVLPVPPRIEQDEIVAHVLAEFERQDALNDHTAREIELLKELRAATLTDAVLGRFDVRDHIKKNQIRDAAA